jgi:hypothetical protein
VYVCMYVCMYVRIYIRAYVPMRSVLTTVGNGTSHMHVCHKQN